MLMWQAFTNIHQTAPTWCCLSFTLIILTLSSVELLVLHLFGWSAKDRHKLSQASISWPLHAHSAFTPIMAPSRIDPQVLHSSLILIQLLLEIKEKGWKCLAHYELPALAHCSCPGLLSSAVVLVVSCVVVLIHQVVVLVHYVVTHPLWCGPPP